ncbi:MAG: hypothetical protein V4628_05155 [Pseudomonadota bacterium]
MQNTGGGLTARAREMLGDMSVREEKLWFELVVDIAVGLYFYPKAFGLMLAGDAALTGRAMNGLIIGTVTWAIILSILLGAFVFNTKQKSEPKDERDLLIERTTGRWFGRILVIGIMAIIGLIVVQAMALDIGSLLFTLTPLSIALLLLFNLMLASLVDSIAKLYCYRRGF